MVDQPDDKPDFVEANNTRIVFTDQKNPKTRLVIERNTGQPIFHGDRKNQFLLLDDGSNYWCMMRENVEQLHQWLGEVLALPKSDVQS